MLVRKFDKNNAENSVHIIFILSNSCLRKLVMGSGGNNLIGSIPNQFGQPGFIDELEILNVGELY